MFPTAFEDGDHRPIASRDGAKFFFPPADLISSVSPYPALVDGLDTHLTASSKPILS